MKAGGLERCEYVWVMVVISQGHITTWPGDEHVDVEDHRIIIGVYSQRWICFGLQLR